MRFLKKLFIIINIIICVVATTYAQSRIESFQYISPLDGAKVVSKETNIIIRQGEVLDTANIDLTSIIQVTGSVSQKHTYKAIINDDIKTLIFQPSLPFEPGEEITVFLRAGITTTGGQVIVPAEFRFTISPKISEFSVDSDNLFDVCNYTNSIGKDTNLENNLTLNDDPSLPSDFPERVITVNNNPDSGYIFLSTLLGDTSPYLMILDSEAYPIFFRELSDYAYDFKIQQQNIMTYFITSAGRAYAMDTTYTVIDSFQCGNGYENNTDGHDFQLLANGHSLLLAQDPQLVDMSEIVPGGDPYAIVTGQIIQELDESKNVVWQWRSWDHFEITDATWDINMLSHRIDYVHCNAIEKDSDGDLLISCRNMDEITKIDYETGEIIWRFGGENNEFTLIGDNRWFSHQHDIRRLPNGNVTLFDNGNLNTPQYARAVEYQLDEINKIAILTWEYRPSPDIIAGFAGNCQRLPSGNSVIGWGRSTPCCIEVRPDGEKAFELNFTPGLSYRSVRYPWHGRAAKPYLLGELNYNIVHLMFNKFGDTTVVGYYIYSGFMPNPTRVIDSTTNNYIDLRLSVGTHHLRVTAFDNQQTESPFSNEIQITVTSNYQFYLPGDVNMAGGTWPPVATGPDVTYLVNYFRGVPTSQSCLLDGFWCSADANGDCSIFGSDVTKLVNVFRGIGSIGYCDNYVPTWLSPANFPDEAPSGWPNCDEMR